MTLSPYVLYHCSEISQNVRSLPQELNKNANSKQGQKCTPLHNLATRADQPVWENKENTGEAEESDVVWATSGIISLWSPPDSLAVDPITNQFFDLKKRFLAAKRSLAARRSLKQNTSRHDSSSQQEKTDHVNLSGPMSREHIETLSRLYVQMELREFWWE